jgi:hypothetical protein
MEITDTEADLLVNEIDGLTAEFIAMVAEQCAGIAKTLPAERIRQGYQDDPLQTGNEIAAAITAQFGGGNLA